MRGFLDALGVPPERVPATLDAQVGAVPQPAGRPADAGRAGQRPRRRAGAPAAARRARLPGRGDQPRPARRPGRPPRARSPLTLDLLAGRRGPRAAGAPARRGPGGGRTGGGRRDHRPVRAAAAGAGHRGRPRGRPSPASPLAALAAELREAAGGLDAFADRGPGHRRAGGVLLVVPAAQPGRRAAVPAARAAPGAGHRRGRPRPAWPGCRPPRRGRCWPSWPGPTWSPSAAAAGTRFHDLLRAYAAELARRSDADGRAARPRCTGCSTTTCTARTRPTGCSTRTATTRSSPPPVPAGVRPEHGRRPAAGAGLVRRRAPGAAGDDPPGRRRRPGLAARLDPEPVLHLPGALARLHRGAHRRAGGRPAAGRPGQGGLRAPLPRLRLHPARPLRRRGRAAARGPRAVPRGRGRRRRRARPPSPGLAARAAGPLPRRRSGTRSRPSTCSARPATGPGRPGRSTRSAGSRPCSATTRRPSRTASRPWTCSATSATGSARRRPGTASGTPASASGRHDGGHLGLPARAVAPVPGVRRPVQRGRQHRVARRRALRGGRHRAAGTAWAACRRKSSASWATRTPRRSGPGWPTPGGPAAAR